MAVGISCAGTSLSDESHGLMSGVAVSDAPTGTEPLDSCAAIKGKKIVVNSKRRTRYYSTRQIKINFQLWSRIKQHI